jgi:hypothetical protein
MHLLTPKTKTMTKTETINELHDFVTTQAAEDAGLSPSEKSYQTELVSDVLGQEAPSHKAFETLLDLYHTERQAA